MESRTKNKKAISFGLLLFAGLFLFTPIIAMVDPFPDAVGLILFVIALSGLCELNDEFSASRRLFFILFLLSIPREALTIWIYTAGKSQNAFEIPTLLLLHSFVWAIVQSLFLIPAFRHLILGLGRLGERYGSDALNLEKRGKTRWEALLQKMTALILLHSVFVTLPEAGALGLQQGAGIEDGFYGFIGLYRTFAGLALFIIWIVWWVRWIAFCRAFMKEKELSGRLAEAKAFEESEHPGRTDRAALYLCLLLCGFAAIVFVPIRVWDQALFPGILCGILAWIALSKLGQKKKWPFCLALILVSALRIGLHASYLAEHLPMDAIYEDPAHAFYLAVRIARTLEILFAALLLIFLYRAILNLIQKRVSVVYEEGEHALDASRHATKKLQDALLKKLTGGLAFILLAAALCIADAFLHPMFSYLWIPAGLFAAIGALAFWIPSFKEITDGFATLK